MNLSCQKKKNPLHFLPEWAVLCHTCPARDSQTGLAKAQIIYRLYYRWVPLVPVSPSPSHPTPLAAPIRPPPRIYLAASARGPATHRPGETIEADQALRREILLGSDHRRHRAKCSSSSRRWSRDPDRASRTSPTPSATPTPPPGAHGRTTAATPRYAPAYFCSRPVAGGCDPWGSWRKLQFD